jgi:hypothetical protein
LKKFLDEQAKDSGRFLADLQDLHHASAKFLGEKNSTGTFPSQI